MSETKVEETKAKEKPAKKVDFISRKLNVLNTKSGAKAEALSARVVENNRGGGK